ncbi:MAG: SAM-dependent methyltransferase [Rhodocyclaceae bacterium]|nr:SAM-dependent methyltransferase [Rhodocyclaceae bacterium]
MSLPEPDAAAREHCARLVAHIQDEIRRDAGWIGFARYMELALYAPGLGYYSGGAQKFGSGGDFITAPELSPLFGACIARQAQQIMQASAPAILEVGAGSGALACDLLAALAAAGQAPEQYAILELSGELRARQAARIARAVPELAERVVWLDRLPDAWRGLIVGNELLDAMPVQLVHWTADGICERGVTTAADGRFAWADRPAQGAVAAAAQALPAEPPYLSEIALAARAWVAAWGERLQSGALLLIDYGFPRHEYYHPQRHQGTLMCHYRHRAHTDPFHLPGLTDITAHVDFTALAEAAHAAGLTLAGYTSQAAFLLNCGLTDVLAQAPDHSGSEWTRSAAAANKLISPSEMGELFKVIAFSRGMPDELCGFARGDRRHAL